jgi:hypothetical protein
VLTPWAAYRPIARWLRMRSTALIPPKMTEAVEAPRSRMTTKEEAVENRMASELKSLKLALVQYFTLKAELTSILRRQQPAPQSILRSDLSKAFASGGYK